MKLNIKKLMVTRDDDLLHEFPWFTRAELRRMKRWGEPKNLPKILLLDIETAPIEALTWWIHQQEIAIGQISRDWFMLCWNAKWLFDPKVEWDVLTPEESLLWNDKRISMSLIDLMNEADIIIGHNWDNFDIKKAKARFLKHWLIPDKVYRTIDTLKIGRREFRLTSNKLQYMCDYCWLNVKLDTGGFELWAEAIGKPTSVAIKSWTKNINRTESFNKSSIESALYNMSNYCANDVLILEELYLRLRPYDRNHPNVWMYMDTEWAVVCPVCGSKHLQGMWHYATQVWQYVSLKCKDCWAAIRSKIKVWK